MCETYDLRKSQCGSGNCFFSRFRSIGRNAKKDQGRDIPPHAEPAASPGRRLQFGQLGGATTIPPSSRLGGQYPPMVVQHDFRKVSGISTEIFRQLESVENDHDATTAAALGAVERRGEMLVRLLDPRQFSRPVQDAVRKFLSLQDALHVVHFVEIVKRPGQTLGLYIREGNGVDRYDGVFVSRIALESAVFNSGCLGVGDEILAVNLVDVTHMSLDDVVILMSIPRRLVLTIRQRRGRTAAMMSSSASNMLRSESKLPPVVVMKKDVVVDQDGMMMTDGRGGYGIDDGDENVQLLSQLGPGPYGSSGRGYGGASAYSSVGRGRMHPYDSQYPSMRQSQQQQQQQMGYSSSLHSLPRSYQHQHQQPHYANLPLQQQYQHQQQQQQQQQVHHQLPDVADYASTRAVMMKGRMTNGDFRLDSAPHPPARRHQHQQYSQSSVAAEFDPYRPDSTHPTSHSHRSQTGSSYPQPYQDWYKDTQHHQHHHDPSPAPPISYQPPPPVITEQPRSSIGPQHFQPFDRQYPKTLESLAEKVHTFYTGPRPSRQQNGGRRPGMNGLPRTGSDQRLSLGRGGAEPSWYGSLPRQQRPPSGAGDFRTPSSRLTPSAGLGGVRSRGGTASRGLPLDYASDSEAMMSSYPTSVRSALSSAATRRSLGLTGAGTTAAGGRSNSLPRDLLRGGRGGGRKPNVRFDKRGLGGMDARKRALLLAAGMDSQDESDGALSAPEMPLTPRRERGAPSATSTTSSSVFTSAEYRAWLSDRMMPRAPSTSAIYERLKTTHRDFDLQQSQKAAKLTYSAENLTLLDRARTRTERQLKLLTESLERENLSNLTQWEDQQRKQEQQRPFYSYRSHLTQGSTLTGADSTLARALGMMTTSVSSSTVTAPVSRDLGGMTESVSLDPLRRLMMSSALTPSRSRDLITQAAAVTAGVGVDGGRRSPSSLLHRLSSDQDDLLRKEILSRTLMGRDYLTATKEPAEDLTTTDLSSVSRLSATALLSGRHSAAAMTTTITTPQGGGSIVSTGTGDSRLKLLTINPSEFSRYKIERPSVLTPAPGESTSTPSALSSMSGHSGILRVHLLAGRALRSTVKSTDSSIRTRDLYCVLECDRVHKARTVVCTGDQNFDWDEVFDLDLVLNKELDFLIYSWDPQLRHRLCYKGSVNLIHVLASPNVNSDNYHQLAIKVEPRGTLYVKLRHTPPEDAFRREPRAVGLFGASLAQIVMNEDSGLNVPLVVQRCIEEIERRGLDIVGVYRLCGSATKKQSLREAFERSPRSVDLSAENVPDINVITGVLKDYLRELPEPLLTKCLYQMLVDALSVCLPDDPEGNARLLFSIIECLPKPNRCTLLLILEHLSLVCSLSDRNKMGPPQLSQCFGPILMVHADPNASLPEESIDFQPPIKVLQYLLETWPAKSVGLLQTVRGAGVEAVRRGPSLLGKGRPFTSPSPILSSSLQQQQQLLHTKSPASILLSRKSYSTPNSHQYLPQSPSKVAAISSSPLSESSPSPTSKVPHYHHSMTTTSMPLIPSSSLPQTTSSNYSIVSEFSTTSVTSPKSIVSASSTRESLVGLSSQQQQPTTSSKTNGEHMYESEHQHISSPSGPKSPPDYMSATATSYSSVSQHTYGQGPDYGYDFSSSESKSGSYRVPPSPFMGRKAMGGFNSGSSSAAPPLPGRAERADFFEDGGSTTTTSSNSSTNSICSKRRLPSVPSKEEPSSQMNNGAPESSGPQPSTSSSSRAYEDPFLTSPDSVFTSSNISFAQMGEKMGRPEEEGEMYESTPPQQRQGGKPVPPPPPPKPGSAMRQRIASSCSSDSSLEDYLPSQQHPNGNGGGESGQRGMNGGGGGVTTNGSGGGGGSGSSTTSTPTTTVQTPPPSAKGSSTTTAQPLGTPPPVPPRLDRRPSHPSPTSSPPAIPPPVPPRLGRSAPVRTPSLDGREAFEVDCYTIKEENGEEDYLN